MFIPFFLGVTFLMQDLFVSRITKTISQKKMLQRKRKRGWFTKEQMQKTLNWSTSLWLQKVMVQYSPPVLVFACHACPMFLKCCIFPFTLPPYQLRSYIKSAVEYCEKPGNERLRKTLSHVNQGGESWVASDIYIALICLLECFLWPTLPMWDIKLQGIQLT